MTRGLPSTLVRAEGLTVAAAAVALYAHLDFGWLAFALLVLAPDLSALGYFAGSTVGAITYDLVHTYVGPVILGAVGVLVDAELATQLALIWLVHIGIDRLLGYGLKYPGAPFRDTHIQRL
jgi:hypothetical protein